MNALPPQTPDLGVTYVRPQDLVPYANNPRQHSRSQIRKIVASLKAHGFVNPILTDEHGNVLCGHGRLQAAIIAGFDRVPTIVLAHMSEAAKRAYIIADNAIAEKAGWSKSMLRVELQGLVELGYDVELTGFEPLEIDSMLSFGEAEPEAEENVELPADNKFVITRIGDVWHIGDHRLAVGDAREIETYERLFADGERAQMILTDPPYGCRIRGNVSGLGKIKHNDFVAGSDGVGPEFAFGLLRPALQCMATFSQPAAIAFVFMDWRGAPYLLDAAKGVFHEVKNLIVWAKTNASNGSFYRSAHELIYAFKISAGAQINNFGLRRHRSNVWQYEAANVFRRGRAEDLEAHPTVKPKRMLADAILDCSKPGGIILDSFAGSGSTLLAAEMTSRRGYGIELDPKYADVILQRLQEATGKEPLLNGATPFSQVAAARRAAS